MKYGECWGCSPEEKSGGQEGSFSKWMRCWKSEWVEEEGRSERETSHVREVKAGMGEVSCKLEREWEVQISWGDLELG